MRASSASGTAAVGVPFTEMTLSRISRSSGLASMISAARARILARSAREPCSTEPLAMVAARLPPVPIMATGVMSVSPHRTSTSSSFTPSSSAATWVRVV